MPNLIYTSCVVLLALSIPFWLPPLVVRVRMYIFTRINGAAAIQLPSQQHGAAEFKQTYTHPNVDIRSRGAALSDLFWYWLEA